MSYTHNILPLGTREKHLFHLGKVFEKLHFSTDLNALLQSTRSDILNILDAEEFFIYIADPSENKLVTYVEKDQEKTKFELSLDYNNLLGYVALKQCPLIINDVYNAKELYHIDSGAVRLIPKSKQ